MNNITKTIQESLEVVDKMRMFPEDRSDGMIDYDRYGVREIKSHLLQSQIKVIEAVIEQRKSELDEHEQNIVRDGNWGYTYGQGKHDGISKALEDQISSLNETLEFLKKSL